MNIKITGLLILILAYSQNGKSEDNTLVWNQDLVADGAMKDVGRNWWNVNSLTFNLTNGTAEVTSACQWDSPRVPPFESGNNFMSSVFVQLGNRPVTPQNVKLLSNPGQGQQKETLVFDQAFQTLEEIRVLFPNNKMRLEISVQGTVDRCDNPAGPGITSVQTITRSIRYDVRCNNNESRGPGVASFRQTIWDSPAIYDFAVTEQKPINASNNFEFDTSSCDGPLFITARIQAEERLIISRMDIQLWGS